MPRVFDRNALRASRERCVNSDSFLRSFAASSICNRLDLLQITSGQISSKRVLEIGAGSGCLTKQILHLDLIVTDSSAKLLALNPCMRQIICDDEELDLQESQNDMVLSCFNLHWINDVPVFLYKIYCNLKLGGIFIANFAGGSSLKHLRSRLLEMEIKLNKPASPHISPYITKDHAAAILQKVGFKSVVAESDLLEVEYPSCLALMRDLQSMGESNKMFKSTGQHLAKGLYLNLLQCREKFIAEFEIITVYGKK